jgi:2-polyprenyl-3-methyl-5-hydroxy-6-metoxy-1,4-benzoquinol methylase
MINEAAGVDTTRPMPSQEELKAFFFALGEVKHVHDIDRAIARVRDREFRRAWQKLRRSNLPVEEVLAFEYGRLEAIRLLIGRDLYPIMAAAALLTQLPPPAPSSKVLDVGGGPGHLALWMLRCWPSTATITVLDRVASAVARDWTPTLSLSPIRFIDGDVPSNLSGVEGERFDRVVLVRMLAQGGHRTDLRLKFLKALTALKPLVAARGDVIVIDHFHGRNMEMAQELADASTSAGFGSVKGWRELGPELTWQLRFIDDRVADVV